VLDRPADCLMLPAPELHPLAVLGLSVASRRRVSCAAGNGGLAGRDLLAGSWIAAAAGRLELTPPPPATEQKA